jgi:hypothetical protein
MPGTVAAILAVANALPALDADLCGSSASRLTGACAPQPNNDPLPLHLVDAKRSRETGAVCLDGSPPGYYYEPPAKPTTQWVIYFKGGGCPARFELAIS